MTTQQPPQDPQNTAESPRETISQGIDTNSTEKINAGLELFRQSRRGLTASTLEWALNFAVKRAKADIVKFLVDDKGARVEGVKAESVGTASREEALAVDDIKQVLEVLVKKGWDINGTGENPQPLINEVIPCEPLVAWCLSHGSTVTDPFLTEEIASHGSLPTLRLVLEHKAPLGRRTLHRAVQSAAYASSTSREERMVIVRYLVEEKGVDVNQMDVPEGEQRPNNWGVPMAYAVPAQNTEGDGGEGVVRWLLEKGANPHIKDCWGLYDVVGLAERMKNEKVLGVSREWEGKKETTD